MDIVTLHSRVEETWLERIRTVSDEQFAGPTPCTDWDVRALINHVIGEDLWTRPLFEGQTVEQVGDRFEGDLLGSDFRQTAEQASKEAVASCSEPGAMERTVHLSFGDFSGEDYAWQLAADHLVHAWDLAVATGGRRELDPELVDIVAEWFDRYEEMYRAGGAVGPRPDLPAQTAQEKLLVAFGRDPGWTPQP